MSGAPEYDYVVVGSGFGGAVSSLRLAEKGYRVLVLEQGRRLQAADFPRTNWQLGRWLWLPALRFFGLFKIRVFRHVTTLSGVGVGGGSLVYANTLLVPPPGFFRASSWAHLADWAAELAPHYATAQTMLGVVTNPAIAAGDVALQRLARDIGRTEDFSPTPVAVYFGGRSAERSAGAGQGARSASAVGAGARAPQSAAASAASNARRALGRVRAPLPSEPDPFFGGAGPDRNPCIECGGCMTGCRFGAKNTLDMNYLYLAERRGAQILERARVVDVQPLGGADGSDGYRVWWRDGTRGPARLRSTSCSGVVFAGGVLGTVRLLLRLRERSLPRLSPCVGRRVRTNSESLIGVTALDRENVFSDGIAIGSTLQVDDTTNLQPVRYSEGSGVWRLLMSPMTNGGALFARIGTALADLARHPIANLRVFFTDDWAKRTQILLFMQTAESTLRFVRGGLFGMKSRPDDGTPPSAFIPRARELAERYAAIVGGKPMVLLTETLLGTPTTAHILGGATMGSDAAEGVIDRDHRVFGYERMYVCDGSAISANPGVNPSLTITALAERAMSKIEPKRAAAVQDR